MLGLLIPEPRIQDLKISVSQIHGALVRGRERGADCASRTCLTTKEHMPAKRTKAGMDNPTVSPPPEVGTKQPVVDATGIIACANEPGTEAFRDALVSRVLDRTNMDGVLERVLEESANRLAGSVRIEDLVTRVVQEQDAAVSSGMADAVLRRLADRAARGA